MKFWEMRGVRKQAGIVMSLVLLFSMTMAGCAKQEAPPEEAPPAEAAKVADYVNTAVGSIYTYEGLGNEYAAFTMTIDFVEGDKVQQRVDNGGTVLARVLEVKDGVLVRTFSREESYDLVNYLNEPSNDNEILLKEPLEPGTSWTAGDGRTRTIISADETVKTPSGTYQTLVVETKGTEDVVRDYYAKGVGLVKTVFRSGDAEISSTLAKIEK